MSDQDFTRRLAGESLTTTEVLYYIPDHPLSLIHISEPTRPY